MPFKVGDKISVVRDEFFEGVTGIVVAVHILIETGEKDYDVMTDNGMRLNFHEQQLEIVSPAE